MTEVSEPMNSPTLLMPEIYEVHKALRVEIIEFSDDSVRIGKKNLRYSTTKQEIRLIRSG